MTREEAINILKHPSEMYQGSDGTVGYTFNPNRRNYEAFQLAIEALEQNKDMTVRANAYAISSGVDIDELSELLKTHHQAIFERAWEQMMNVDPNPDLSDFLDDIEFLGEDKNNVD